MKSVEQVFQLHHTADRTCGKLSFILSLSTKHHIIDVKEVLFHKQLKSMEFAITIGKATYTERVDGGTMMLEAISKCKTGETTAIGKFHGFELLWKRTSLTSIIWCFVERLSIKLSFPQVLSAVW